MSQNKSTVKAQKRKLGLAILITFLFCVAELAVGFKTKSLALITDAFHYMNDSISFVVAYAALQVSEKSEAPQGFSFGWQRAQLLGAFFNGTFLVALSISIFLQAIERFISPEKVNNPKLVLIMGGIGLGLNVLVLSFLHTHDHDHNHNHSHNNHSHGHSHGSETDDEQHIEHNHTRSHTHSDERKPSGLKKFLSQDLGRLGVLAHVFGDAMNNLGVIATGAVIWKVDSPHRYYADPALSMFIALLILGSSYHVTLNSGKILLETAPDGLNLENIRHDLEKIPGVDSAHNLHVWRLNENKTVASVHLVVSDASITEFMTKARTVSECLHAYGIHSYTIQPEMLYPDSDTPKTERASTVVVLGPDSSFANVDGTKDSLMSGNLPGQSSDDKITMTPSRNDISVTPAAVLEPPQLELQQQDEGLRRRSVMTCSNHCEMMACERPEEEA